MKETSPYIWNVYLEPADTDEPARFIGTIDALYEGQALELASQYFEVPSHDLIVKRSDLDKKEV